MYIKKDQGPVIVRLPNGTRMSRADLPPVSTTRWVASRKAAVVRAVVGGLISKKQACERYGLSEEEYETWQSAVTEHGEKALKATDIQKYRQL